MSSQKFDVFLSHNSVDKPAVRQLADALEAVLLIHGIRDHGAWHQAVDRAMGSESLQIVAPRYGYFPALRFLAPWDTSKGPLERVYRQFLNSKTAFPDAKISVVAHSFGTYLFTKMMQAYPELRVWRVILCGSVVEQGFAWERIKDQIGEPNDSNKSQYIVNDCGNRDSWPVLGAACGWRYGNAGTDGFGSAFVKDRFHEGGHGLFFAPTFIKKYWQPFLVDGRFVPGDANQGEGVPWYLRLLGRLPLRWLQVVLPALVAWIIYLIPPDSPTVDATFDEFVSAYSAAAKGDDRDMNDFVNKYENEAFDDWTCFVADAKRGDKSYKLTTTKARDVAPPEDQAEDLPIVVANLVNDGDIDSTLVRRVVRIDGHIYSITPDDQQIVLVITHLESTSVPP